MKFILFLLVLPMVGISQPLPVVNSFPSLSIGTHSRGWGMGGSGIASSLENQTLSYNVARAVFAQNIHQASFTYLPWMRSISNDTRFIRADYLTTMGSSSAMGFAINYLDLGTIAMRDAGGATLGLFRSNEFNLGTSYALQLNGSASIGATMRFIGSRYYGSVAVNQYSVCGDIGYYQFAKLGDGGKVQWGAVVSNLGGVDGLPSTVGIGAGYTKHSEGSQWNVTVDASRLIKDSWKGVRINAGAEYGFDESFFLRGGVSLENKFKGNRKFFSLGFGYKGFVSDQSWGVDVHYLIPFGLVAGVSPFQNQFGLTLSVNIGNF